MRDMLWRAFRLIGAIFLLGWLVVFPHEGFHQLVTQSLGFVGRISYNWGGYGFMEYVLPYPSDSQRVLIGLAGGLGTGIILLLFWWLTGHPDIRKHPSEVDNTFPFMLFGIMSLVYAPFDGFLEHVNFGSALGMVIGFSLPLLIYWKPLMMYLDGKEAT